MVRWIGCLVLCFTLPLAVSAADEKPKLNTLTQKEIEAGWILLFDGETTMGWEVGGLSEARHDRLKVWGAKGSTAIHTARFHDLELQFEYQVEPPNETFGNEFTMWHCVGQRGLKLIGNEKGWERVTMKIEGGTFHWERFLEDTSLETGKGKRHRDSSGEISFDVRPGHTLLLRNVKARPLTTKTISPANDLAGWRPISDKKSKFTVNEKGELSITDGPGDIQTEKEYDDFILQLDIKSNGDRLNSGVFFRCVKGEFWSGYEAQIRNEWVSEVTLKDGTKLMGSYREFGDEVELKLCEVKDKKVTLTKETRKLAKSEIKEVAHRRDLPVDFGTGGVYGHQPARKVVSSDSEWFTMTIIAHGNHIAVWVNGYQTADFTDIRPADKTARKGTKTNKGPISLQGHDPTTNLSFRNIRVAELTRGEK